MKNTILVAGALLVVGSFTTSCKKDYICKCSKTYTSSGGSTTLNYSEYTYKDTRPTADSRCSANNDTGSDLGGDYSINCEIQ